MQKIKKERGKLKEGLSYNNRVKWEETIWKKESSVGSKDFIENWKMTRWKTLSS